MGIVSGQRFAGLVTDPCFWSFKTGRAALCRTFRLIIDVLFMVALSIMVVVCAVIAYSIA